MQSTAIVIGSAAIASVSACDRHPHLAPVCRRGAAIVKLLQDQLQRARAAFPVLLLPESLQLHRVDGIQYKTSTRPPLEEMDYEPPHNDD